MRLVTLAAAIALAGCRAQAGDQFADARQLISARCGSCHRVPGVPGATGRVGPSLDGIGRQQIIAGYFPNSRDNMIGWISHPHRLLPGNAMPDTGLTPDQASRIADYLYTLD